MRALAAPALAALLLAALPPALGAQRMAFAVAPDVAVRIHNLTGLTRVVAWERDSIDVVATVPPGGGRLYGAGGGGGAKLGIEGGDPAGPGATLVVRVPRLARVWVKSATADVDFEGLAGEAEVSTVTGAVRLRGDPRVASIETIDGPVEVAGAATVLRVRTGAGRVAVTGARGDLSVATVGGPVTLREGELLSARIETVSGAVDVAGPLAARGRLEVQTHDGDVRLALPASVEARFELLSVGGSVVTRLAGAPERRFRDGQAAFTTGAGKGKPGVVTVRSFKGAIRVDTNPSP